VNDRYTHTANGRTWKLSGCAKRGCDHINPDYLAFGVGFGADEKTYCLNHIPLRARFRLWWQERRNS
jgi:hypothetical protein